MSLSYRVEAVGVIYAALHGVHIHGPCLARERRVDGGVIAARGGGGGGDDGGGDDGCGKFEQWPANARHKFEHHAKKFEPSVLHTHLHV